MSILYTNNPPKYADIVHIRTQDDLMSSGHPINNLSRYSGRCGMIIDADSHEDFYEMHFDFETGNVLIPRYAVEPVEFYCLGISYSTHTNTINITASINDETYEITKEYTKDLQSPKEIILAGVEEILDLSKESTKRKVFSIAKWIENSPIDRTVIADCFRNGWPQKLDGKTVEECEALGYPADTLMEAAFVEIS